MDEWASASLSRVPGLFPDEVSVSLFCLEGEETTVMPEEHEVPPALPASPLFLENFLLLDPQEM